MNLKFELIEDAKSYKALFSSMIASHLGPTEDNITVKLTCCDDPRVPYSAVISAQDIKGEAVSSNILAAFTQSLNRLETKLRDAHSVRA